MPYISSRRRVTFQSRGLQQLCGAIREGRSGTGLDGMLVGAGDLAYIVYCVLLAFAPKGSRFAERNAMMGAVDEARMEYRRRMHEPAEDQAIAENGDIE